MKPAEYVTRKSQHLTSIVKSIQTNVWPVFYVNKKFRYNIHPLSTLHQLYIIFFSLAECRVQHIFRCDAGPFWSSFNPVSSNRKTHTPIKIHTTLMHNSNSNEQKYIYLQFSLSSNDSNRHTIKPYPQPK